MENTVINIGKLTDINLSFLPNPNTGDIAKLSNFAVIRRSLEIILTMGILEKPFREDLGSSLKGELFELVSNEDIPAFESQIKNVIERYEPRIGLQDLQVQPDFPNNRLEVTIVYFIRATQRQDTFKTVLNISE